MLSNPASGSKSEDEMSIFRDKMRKAREALAWGIGILEKDTYPTAQVKGEVFFKMEDAYTGQILAQWHKKNLIVLDAGILVARLCKDNQEPNFGINMLAVGTGATGALLSPDAPDEKQRRLNNEIERKPFASTTYRNTSGVAVSFPTNIVDFTTVFDTSEAVGPLNEMGLHSTISANPLTLNPNPNTFPTYDATVDVTNYDMLVNYLPFGVIVKPGTATLTITWRLTF